MLTYAGGVDESEDGLVDAHRCQYLYFCTSKQVLLYQ